MDKITSELIRTSLTYASEEMGVALRNSSYSPNIKERMDHSAALFDAEGKLLAQAEHIPVHLGSLPWGLKNIIEFCRKENIASEDNSMLVVNNPYIAGTHLNDFTVVKPIFFSDKLVGFAANKAHHADVGGKVPGSISPDARTLFEEGIIINPVHLVRKGEFVKEVLSLVASNSRTPRERVGDLKAQVAANVTGERRFLDIINKYSLQSFLEASKESFEYAERLMVSRIRTNVRKGTFSATDFLEDPDGHDVKLMVSIKVSDEGIEIDYTGTDAELDNPLNAVYGVTLSGVYFVIRTLTGDDIPANYGAFNPIKPYVPQGTVLNPTFPHPVGGGNVETSQRNADLLYRAFSRAMPDRVPAASGGSMNNLMLGGVFNGRSWAFYETIGSGLGGRKGIDGIDGIQHNMTNTMNTPIEEIERSLPLLMKKYEFRLDSSGAGQFRGGSGLVRGFENLADGTIVTVLSDRERHGPWGLLGGGEGAKVRIILRSRYRTIRLPTKSTTIVKKGEEVEINTAGGGGYGPPRRRNPVRIEDDLENGVITKSYAKAHYPTRET